jgi:hypothetical protein
VEQQYSRIEDSEMHRDYVRDEGAFRAAASRLIEHEMTLRERVRSRVDLSAEERQNSYMQGHQTIMEEYDRLAGEFGRQQGKAVAAAQNVLYKEGASEHYAEMLARAASTPDEKLPELMQLASQSGLADLERAVDRVADQRKPGGTSELFDAWVAKDPKRQAARDRLAGTPRLRQFEARLRAVKPPRANADDLTPTATDEQRAADERAAKSAARVEFFGGTPRPRRQVGSRIE